MYNPLKINRIILTADEIIGWKVWTPIVKTNQSMEEGGGSWGGGGVSDQDLILEKTPKTKYLDFPIW